MAQLPDTLSFNDVGGTKTDYSAVVDSSTDRSATEVNTAFCAAVQATRTVARGWIRMTLNGASAPTLVSTTSWNTVWRGGTSTAPVLDRSTNGVLTITLPSTVLDEQGASHTVNIQSCQVCLEGSFFYPVTAYPSSANIITVKTATALGTTPADLSGIICSIWFN